MIKPAEQPTILISDKGETFVSQVIKEMTGVLGNTLKHATTKHAQLIVMLEQCHASTKKALKIEIGERRSSWHKRVSIVVLDYHTSYHASIGCEPSRVFHGRIPYNVLDLNLRIRPQQAPFSASQIAQDVLHQTQMIYQDVRRNAMQAYRRRTLQNSKKQNMFICYNRKQIIKGVKVLLRTSYRLGRMKLKRCCRTTTILYAKMAKTRFKVSLACNCVISNSDVQITPQKWKLDP